MKYHEISGFAELEFLYKHTYCDKKTHNIKFIILTILSVQFGDIKYIHIVVQPLPPSISKTFLIFMGKSSIPIKQ